MNRKAAQLVSTIAVVVWTLVLYILIIGSTSAALSIVCILLALAGQIATTYFVYRINYKSNVIKYVVIPSCLAVPCSLFIPFVGALVLPIYVAIINCTSKINLGSENKEMSQTDTKQPAVMQEQIDPSKITFLVDSTERIEAYLGSGFLKSFLINGIIDKAFSIVTDKRVYFKGKCLRRNHNNKWKASSEEHIVDLQDITGTAFINSWDMGLLAKAIAIGLIGLAVMGLGVGIAVGAEETSGMILWFLGIAVGVVGLVMLLAFFIKRVNFFEISFAGGGVRFKTNMYSQQEIRDFQKQLRLSKDEAKTAQRTVAQTVVQQVPMQQAFTSTGNSIEQLKEASELLKQGVLNQDEFNKLKSDILNHQ